MNIPIFLAALLGFVAGFGLAVLVSVVADKHLTWPRLKGFVFLAVAAALGGLLYAAYQPGPFDGVQAPVSFLLLLGATTSVVMGLIYLGESD